jgi:hypothetical protein
MGMNALASEARPVLHYPNDSGFPASSLNPLPRRLEKGLEGRSRVLRRVNKFAAVKMDI